ncbi:hypothetical protein VNO80_08831 [Phaseolus coccineus]|uniref:Uncharacterized protein n=1 Tax=Phaseolus coccineus TaxID=3886 RepID=A0AAN9NAB5_PHACN
MKTVVFFSVDGWFCFITCSKASSSVHLVGKSRWRQRPEFEFPVGSHGTKQPSPSELLGGKWGNAGITPVTHPTDETKTSSWLAQPNSHSLASGHHAPWRRPLSFQFPHLFHVL